MKTCLWKLFQYCFVLFITLTIAPPWIVEVCVERPVQEQQQDKCSELYLYIHNWRSIVSKISSNPTQTTHWPYYCNIFRAYTTEGDALISVVHKTPTYLVWNISIQSKVGYNTLSILMHEVLWYYCHAVCLCKHGPQHFHLLSLWDGHIIFYSVQCSQYQVEKAYCRPAVMGTKVLACTGTRVYTLAVDVATHAVLVHGYTMECGVTSIRRLVPESLQRNSC